MLTKYLTIQRQQLLPSRLRVLFTLRPADELIRWVVGMAGGSTDHLEDSKRSLIRSVL